MSDYGYDPMTDPYALSDEELLNYILGSAENGGVYGKDPSARLTTLSKMQSLLNGPLITSMFPSETSNASTQPTLAPNLQRQVYGGNPMFKALFDTMDSGADPYSAVSAVSQAVADGKYPDITPQIWENQKEQVLKIAQDYGMEGARNANDYAAAQQKAAGSQDTYLMSDGTPYKGSNLGRGTMGSASEFELLGAPSADELKSELVAQYAANNPKKGTHVKRPDVSGMKWANAPGYTANKAEFDSVFDTIDAVNDSAASTAAASKKFDNKVTDFLVKERLDKAKGTQVRSEASKQLAYKIMALRSLAGA